MKRLAENYLQAWKDRADRKPLLLRGARQVGKTYLVEQWGRQFFPSFLRIDLEKRQDLHSVFDSNNPQEIIQTFSAVLNTEILPRKTLLFLDEIQACPKAIAALRYFYEDLPELHVLAAGSLLDFVLSDFPYSMPVGRIEFLYLNPMSFEEFLFALGENPVLDFIKGFELEKPIPDALHQKCVELLRKYFFVGGMPEAVSAYVQEQNPVAVARIHASILGTLESDFSKYGTRTQAQHMRQILTYIPRHVGEKVKYVAIDRLARSKDLKVALELLVLARVIHRVRHSAANGIPLGAEAVENCFKTIFLDIGLLNQGLGLGFVPLDQLLTVQEGGLAEQYVGQELLNWGEVFEDKKLYFWTREAKNSNAEVDYVIAKGAEIIPVETKAGKTGSLKSLHVFLAEKKRKMAVRLNLDQPSVGNFQTKIHTQQTTGPVEFRLLSLPLYLTGQVLRLIPHF